MKTERQRAINRADQWFSKYIRTRGATIQGYNKCFTCGKIDHWKSLDCGHFQGRQHLATRWDEHNCQPQCKKCNAFEEGRKYEFGKQLNAKYGEGEAERLIIKSAQTVKFSTIEIRAIADHYRKLFNENS